MDILCRPAELEEFAAHVRQQGGFAIDMEFERERTYRPILQLVQLATRERAVLVDPLEFQDLGPVWDLVADPDLPTLFHAGRQDLEIFWHESDGRLPQNLFDSQIAAALVGMGEQVGYADLVRRVLGIHLKKGERTTDWGRRPLSTAQMQYALDDVLHLHDLVDRLRDDLSERGRTEWLREEMAFYSEPGTWERSPDELWLRVSRHRSLSGKNLAVLRELAVWREESAIERNVPRNRVVADDVLIDLARRLPSRVEELGALRRLHHREIERGGEAIVEAVRAGLDCPREDWPRLPKIREDDADLNLAIDLLSTFVKLRSREIQIAASYLGSKKDVTSFAYAHKAGRDRSDLALGHGWRYELVGRDLEKILDGAIELVIVDGAIQVRER